MATTTNARKMFFNQHGWQGLGMLNLVLGLFLCLYAFTDISLAGTIADLLFPPIVLALSILSYRILPDLRDYFAPSEVSFHPLVVLGRPCRWRELHISWSAPVCASLHA